jgi:adenine-specific DNA methylase
MNQQLLLTVVEITISLIIEGVILSMIFNWIANKETTKQEQNLQQEMNNIETQNKFIYEQLQEEIRLAKTELISQIKESTNKGGKN